MHDREVEYVWYWKSIPLCLQVKRIMEGFDVGPASGAATLLQASEAEL